MSIDAIWEDEDGKRIETVYDIEGRFFISLNLQLVQSRLPNSHCLRFLDHHGDTVFNWIQIPFLIKELSVIKEMDEFSRAKSHILSVIEISEKSLKDVHTYIRFFGE